MTTPTTNYGILKPDATERADIRVINNAFIGFENAIQNVIDTELVVVPFMGCWDITSVYEVLTTDASSTDFTNGDINISTDGVWREKWRRPNATFGDVGFTPPNGEWIFNESGIYRITYHFNVKINPSYSEGFFEFALKPTASSAPYWPTHMITVPNLYDGMTTVQHSCLVKVASSSADIPLDEYFEVVWAGGNLSGTTKFIQKDPNNFYWWQTAWVEIEWVRPI